MGNKFICDETCIAHTKAGDLQGYFFNDVYNFKGIQYATAKRFQAPEPVEALLAMKAVGKRLSGSERKKKLWVLVDEAILKRDLTKI